MPSIELDDTVGLGLIISYESGVVYSNQTGGTACLSPEYEGVFLSLRNDCAIENNSLLSPEIDLCEYFKGPVHKGAGATNGIDSKDIEYIESVLKKYKLDSFISIDRNQTKKSHEAWVYVLITSDSDVFSGFEPFPREAVLTWTNSD